MKKQRGISIYMFMYVLITLGFAGFIGLKVFPIYLEYYSVKKIIASMAIDEAIKGASVNDIRKSFDNRAVIAYVTVIKGEDLEVTKESGETVVSAAWAVKVPLFTNASLIMDFNAATNTK